MFHLGLNTNILYLLHPIKVQVKTLLIFVIATQIAQVAQFLKKNHSLSNLSNLASNKEIQPTYSQTEYFIVRYLYLSHFVCAKYMYSNGWYC